MEFIETPFMQNVLFFATVAHCKQLRKYTNEPYINHPVNVARIVNLVTDDETMLAAALLHDTVEDTDVTLTEIADKFGTGVAFLVSELTDVSTAKDGNREQRKALDREHLAKACDQAKTIKLADLIDNSMTIVGFDPSFAKVYLDEKDKLLDVLVGGDQKLWHIANGLVRCLSQLV
jgi:guanosine-3',5'-bis(diphosphate) 3'-pyrophosphohydrolase